MTGMGAAEGGTELREMSYELSRVARAEACSETPRDGGTSHRLLLSKDRVISSTVGYRAAASSGSNASRLLWLAFRECPAGTSSCVDACTGTAPAPAPTTAAAC